MNRQQIELGRQPGAEDHKGSGEYKNDRRDPKQEHGSRRIGQGPLGAARARRESLSVRTADGSIGNGKERARTEVS